MSRKSGRFYAERDYASDRLQHMILDVLDEGRELPVTLEVPESIDFRKAGHRDARDFVVKRFSEPEEEDHVPIDIVFTRGRKMKICKK